MQIREILKKQRDFFDTGATLSLKFRKEMLKKLYSAVSSHGDELEAALYADLGKSRHESYMCEIGGVLSEISHMIKKLPKYIKARKVRTPIAQFPSDIRVRCVPFGNVLIMSPWNYPILLTLSPLTDAIAAGNTAVVKPSAYSPKTSEMIAKLLSEIFPSEYVAAVTGGRAENQALLDEKFDMVFFTGSSNVGKEVLRHAAENLTPTVLELGGKSPCIVDKSADIPLAARRIVFGKLLNAGQTCVAPDYILCDKEIKDRLISEIKKEMIRQYGDDPISNPDYPRIVNEKHFDRLVELISAEKAVTGAVFDRSSLKIAPTVLDNADPSDPAMGEEIFGPILPVLSYSDIGEVFSFLKDKPKPLALYIFSNDKRNIKNVTERIRFGGGCVNDTVIHVSVGTVPFGGVGESGMGSYHGESGFCCFSHKKSTVHKKKLDLPMRYQPYEKKHEKTVRRLLK